MTQKKSRIKLVNLILNFAQFIIYRNYIRDLNQETKHRNHAVYLLRELKAEIRLYITSKFIQRKLDKREIKQLCKYLS